MSTVLVHDEAMGAYRLSPSHPMRPERFTLAIRLLEAWGCTGGRPLDVVRPSSPASEDDLLVAHTPEYIDFVKAASLHPSGARGHGIGDGDTPAFAGMHEAAALAVGATKFALDAVLDGRATRAANLSGGLHHAVADRASGFCVYNDAAVAIRLARRAFPHLRVAYIDIDAHHGDGVEAAFDDDAGVLTVSIHESGQYLFPGTGDARDVGVGKAMGSVLNVPLAPYSGPPCFRIAWATAILPSVEAFAPDLIVLQAGADSHWLDPLTHLRQTIPGYLSLIEAVARAADRLCGGRLVLLGGGGYLPFDQVPRMWASAVATVAGSGAPDLLPPAWTAEATRLAAAVGAQGPTASLTVEDEEVRDERSAPTIQAVGRTVETLLDASPLFSGASAAGPVAALKQQLAHLVDRELDACFGGDC